MPRSERRAGPAAEASSPPAHRASSPLSDDRPEGHSIDAGIDLTGSGVTVLDWAIPVRWSTVAESIGMPPMSWPRPWHRRPEPARSLIIDQYVRFPDRRTGVEIKGNAVAEPVGRLISLDPDGIEAGALSGVGDMLDCRRLAVPSEPRRRRRCADNDR